MRAQGPAKPVVASTPEGTPEGTRSGTPEGFRSVTGGDQMQSGELLLVEAYACFWLIAFAMIFLTWRKQRALDRRVAELEAALARASRGGVAREAGGH